MGRRSSVAISVNFWASAVIPHPQARQYSSSITTESGSSLAAFLSSEGDKYMKNKSIYIASAAVLAPLALFLHTFSASPLPTPKPYAGPVPSATPPKEVAVFALVTGVNHRVAGYGYRGGSVLERRDFSMAGTLVRHPKGDLLIDTGLAANRGEREKSEK